MLINFWNTVFYNPLLNLLVLFVSFIPNGDIGLAVILLTILVKIILFPLSKKSIESQAKMNKLAPEIEKIKNSGISKEEQARQTFDLYKQNKTNPFSGCLIILVQIPIIFALYHVFLKGIKIDSNLLYSFVKLPQEINTMFLGLVDISSKSLLLAILAGITQYLQAHFMPKPAVSLIPNSKGNSFSESFAKNMQLQMKYVFPFLIAFVAYSVSGAVALYFITSNIFATIQQIYLNKKEKENLQ